MARILGGIACSHTPRIGFPMGGRKQNDPIQKPVFEGIAPPSKRLAEKLPGARFNIANDPRASFFFDHDSAAALNTDNDDAITDVDGGQRHLPAFTALVGPEKAADGCIVAHGRLASPMGQTEAKAARVYSLVSGIRPVISTKTHG